MKGWRKDLSSGIDAFQVHAMVNFVFAVEISLGAVWPETTQLNHHREFQGNQFRSNIV